MVDESFPPCTDPASLRPEPGEVWIRDLGGPFAQEVRTEHHCLVADEPADQGGEAKGPSPYELLLAGLGSCTAMTLKMYARAKELPLEGVGVRLRHRKIHAQDCAHCETREGRIDRIERVIHLQGPLTEEQRARLLAIAERCPVHRTLQSEIDITTRLLD